MIKSAYRDWSGLAQGLNAGSSICWLGGLELGMIPLYDLVLGFSLPV